MKDTLNARFAAPLPDYYPRRIIVWQDEQAEFADTVAQLELDNARILTMGSNNMFELRRQIEVDYANENLLLYCPMAFANPQDNYLQDVFLYSEEFRADYWSMLFAQLNINNTRSLRDYAKGVSGFFTSKERTAKLHALRSSYQTEWELQTGIFCVLCGAKTYGFGEVLRLVLACPPDEENPLLAAIAKHCGENAFWRACETAYGYVGEHSLDSVACHMLVSAAMHSGAENCFPGLPYDAAHTVHAYAFFVECQRVDREGLLNLCQRVEGTFRVDTLLKRMNRDALMRMGVFPVVDQMLLESALLSFADGHFNLDDAENLLRARRDQPWEPEYSPYYHAIRQLICLQRFDLAYHQGFHFTTPKELWHAYTDELYQMDQHHRTFCLAYEQSLSLGITALEDALKAAADAVESLYKRWLSELNSHWTSLIAAHGLNSMSTLLRQHEFYDQRVSTADSRVFVIISDGLRYETAHELCQQLHGKLTGNTHCTSMLGTLPGITPVGMAALLPHRNLTLTDDLKVLCDGMGTDAPQREKVLQATKPESVAIQYDAFRRGNKSQRSELIKGKRVVYIYHDAIDRAGEGGANVPMACETAISELSQLMRILVNEFSAASVFITADHGFLFTRAPLDEYEKTDKELLHGTVLEYKRRYAIVNGTGDAPAVTLPLDDLQRPDLCGVFPAGSMRFKQQGGSSGYVHGGVSLQEMVIPLLHYQNKKAGQKGFAAITKPNIVLLGENRTISNNIFTLNFYQEQPCTGKVQPRTVVACFTDRAGKSISDEHRLICDMTSTENQQRTMRITFRLLGSGFDPHTTYDLVLRDEDEKADLQRIPFRISIAFENDFGF